MALLDVLRPSAPAPSTEVPAKIKLSLDRGRRQMLKDAPKRRLCMHFEKGNTYWWLDSKNALNEQPTVTNPNGSGKAPHRIRNKYNFIRPIVQGKVSASTQKIPSYEINPTTSDPEDYSAAKLAEKVALYGYDKWRLRNTTTKVVTLAIGHGGDGFALPYFDPNVGPYSTHINPETGETESIGQGEIKVLALSGNEVYWESGCDFYDSRWWAIERATPVEDVREMPGFYGFQITPDASTSDIPTDRSGSENLVMKTEYFERPCPKYPEGRRLVIVNSKQACPEEGYPLRDAQGRVIDEPLLHRLSYTVDPDTDRDFGLTWQLIDAQRTIQDCWNKLLEWKNRTLNPQMIAAVGSLIDAPDDTPGAVKYYKGQIAPQWEQPPQVPEALRWMLEQMKQDMREMGADQNIEAASNVAAKTVAAVIEQSDNRWQSFLGDLAEFHSRLMRHCLLLVARHYSEQRLLGLRGHFGPERVPDFRGANLMDQVDVTVFPGSLTVRTRQETQNMLSWIAATFPGYLSPEASIAALNGGNGENLVLSYELDVARADRIIQAIRAGTVMKLPGRMESVSQTMPDGTVQEEQLEVPSYMPSQADSIPIWKSRFGDFMKTEEYELIDPAMQEVTNQIWSGIQWQETQKQQAALAAQNAQAAQQGLDNAAKPQVKGMPSLPGSDAAPPAT